MKDRKNKVQLKYDADADVLSIEGRPDVVIDHAKEMGNLVVHFSKNDEPVLIEVLEASQTLRGQTVPLQRFVALAK